MTARLKSLTVENFRSIRGRVHVSLDAPVVLIHGPNGTGKTSLLSAIELGLTGQLATFARVDPGYVEHLPHKEAPLGEGHVALTLDGMTSAVDADLTVNGQSILGRGALAPDDARFFAERCYLAQSTLGRLLEIYQNQDARRSDSPLTRFVKELLGLERLDSLIEGLHSAGHVNRLRDPVPAYWAARADIPDLQQRTKTAVEELTAARSEIAVQSALLRQLLGETAPRVSQDVDTAALLTTLAEATQNDERQLQDGARRRRDLIGAIEQVRASNATGAETNRQTAETDLAASREALDGWRKGKGADLAAVIEELQRDYHDVPSPDPDSTAAHNVASGIVTSERMRLQRMLDIDTDEGQKLAQQRSAIRQGAARIAGMDRELAEAAGANEELARSLSALVPHIHNETCPVCERDFGEISPSKPLAARLAERISSLVSAAGRLQSLAKDRTTTATAVNLAQRVVADLESRQLTEERRDTVKNQLARLKELELRLAGLANVALEGHRLQENAANSAQRVAVLGSRHASIEGLRGFATELAQAFGAEGPAEGEPLEMALLRLQDVAMAQEAVIAARLADHRQANGVIAEVVRLRSVIRAGEAAETKLRTRLARLTTAKTEADRRIELAKDLVRRARDVRTAMVRKVFNDDLNALWRDLFIRLAPDEAFVPAFALPSSSTGPVEAVLETLHRSGGKGGNPRAMLSAGNLNTAALTLFLSLHLTVRAQVPWLIIDDPVQSMDEVHIAQFAALLRSLKQTKRQVIIAVHERSLFEYLALELSPTHLDDRLITIELGRGSDGMTVAPWTPQTFVHDRALEAAA